METLPYGDIHQLLSMYIVFFKAMTIDASAVIIGCYITAQRMVHYSTSDDKITARRMGNNSAGNAAGTYTTMIL